jgi:hypothetical protein
VIWAKGVGVNCSWPEQATNKKQNGSSRVGLKQRSWKIADLKVVIVNLDQSVVVYCIANERLFDVRKIDEVAMKIQRVAIITGSRDAVIGQEWSGENLCTPLT